jgi:hypothetical protein
MTSNTLNATTAPGSEPPGRRLALRTIASQKVSRKA